MRAEQRSGEGFLLRRPPDRLPRQRSAVERLTIRALQDGDAGTVAALFARLGARSRERRFCGAKPRLSELELKALARIDGDHHVLVGYIDGDPEPAGIARLARDGAVAEIAFAVADVYQGRGVGSILARELAAHARAAGIRELVATVCGDNSRAVSLLKLMATRLGVSWCGREREFFVELPASPDAGLESADTTFVKQGGWRHMR